MDIGLAIVAMKDNKRVQRAGWNGKGMYLVFMPGYPDGIPANKATAQMHGIEEGTTVIVDPYIAMKTAGDSIVPWLASQTDLLADDWQIV